jgi:RIO kinase 1
MNEALDLLLADGVIDEILSRLKSGKEANVYLVRKGEEVVAAKVYKDRQTRGFKNNADYKEGRKTRNSRTQRAIESGGRFGREADEQAWKATEANALSTLHAHGVRVPRSVLFYEGVLLMELVVDAEGQAAPRLIDVALERETARALYVELRGQLIGLLCCEIIHGDLSPYNILLAAAGPTIIDFPQIVSAAHNSRAEFFFLRDFTNVLNHFVAADPSLAANASDGPAIWRAYVQRDLSRDFVPPPPRPQRPPQPARPPGPPRRPHVEQAPRRPHVEQHAPRRAHVEQAPRRPHVEQHAPRRPHVEQAPRRPHVEQQAPRRPHVEQYAPRRPHVEQAPRRPHVEQAPRPPVSPVTNAGGVHTTTVAPPAPTTGRRRRRRRR